MYAHSYAVTIEQIMRRVFNEHDLLCYPLLLADEIESRWYVSIATALGFMYANANDEQKDAIFEFVDKNYFILEFQLSELLEFTSSIRKVGISETDISPYKNGEEAITDVIRQFRELCNNVNNK